ncbi:hypothetical protein FBQ97_02880 [Acidobacteria bacterium ACD]|nr:MAG: hypothetical protein EDX89_16740 [Acidobacteriota bacterium]MCE7960210.1 hypothetical protein [Acidobacteria bacterium ACB2]MDL1948743.1 hypothetical protein [Acidobacteria bacterium ACD]
MGVPDFLALLGALLVLSYAAEALFHRTRIPPVVLLIGAGVALGPLGGALPGDSFRVAAPYFGGFALVVILFEAGLDLDLDQTSRGVGAGAALAGISFFLTAGTIALFGHGLLGLPTASALALGALLGAPSSAVVLPLVARLGLREELKTRAVIDATLADVLGILGFTLAVDSFRGGSVAGALIRGVGTGFVIGVAVAVFLGLLWSRALRWLSGGRFGEALTLGIVLLLHSGLHALGGGAAVAVVAFGLTLSNEPVLLARLVERPALPDVDAGFAVLKGKLHDFISQTTFLVRTFFFVLLGLVVDWRGLEWRAVGVSALFLAVVLLARRATVVIVRRAGLLDATDDEGSIFSALHARGLVTAVLALEAAASGLPGAGAFPLYAFALLLATNLLVIPGLWGPLGRPRAEETPPPPPGAAAGPAGGP